jgi:hypothetical protein
MRKIVIALLALSVFAASSAFAANAVRISQVYGGGGNSGAYYRYDYVELFNNSGAPVNIGGWTLMYTSATGASFGGTANFYVAIPAGATIPSCGYYLIQLASGANTAAANLPVAPDVIGTIAASATAGKFGLLGSTATTGTCATAWVDLVGYGPTASCFEGSAATAILTNTAAAVRGGAGMNDTDQNGADFAAVTCNSTLPIHSSGSAINPLCTVTPTTGACCIVANQGGCVSLTPAACAAANGDFLGLGVPCVGGECSYVPAIKGSWGQIKTIYR